MSIKIDKAEFTRRFRIKLIQLRYARKISQNKLADLSGLNHNMIKDYENGRNLPTIWSFYKLCKGLGVSSNEILGF